MPKQTKRMSPMLLQINKILILLHCFNNYGYYIFLFVHFYLHGKLNWTSDMERSGCELKDETSVVYRFSMLIHLLEDCVQPCNNLGLEVVHSTMIDALRPRLCTW